MWWINLDEAIEIYARFCRARFGDMAMGKVRTRAMELRRAGDLEGGRVWDEVAKELDRLENVPLRPVLAESWLRKRLAI
jgi:hypothetical protein